MRINRKESFRYFEELLGDNYYVGLHGISNHPDIENEYFKMNKEEKAKNILNIGLLNHRKKSIKSTCRIFGRLSTLYNKDKKSILEFNKFLPYRSDNNNYVIVVAIPIVFEHSDGRKIFGGWMNPNIHYNDDNSPFECITDLMFYDKIPKEMILGYYNFNTSDEELAFTPNNKHYSYLEQEEKDKFIKDYFDENDFVIDLNNLSNKYKYDGVFKDYYKFINGRYMHITSFLIDNIENELKEYSFSKSFSKEDTNLDFYTFEELENLTIEEINIEKIKPDLNILINSKYAIRDIFINKLFENNKSLAKEVGYYLYNSVNDMEYIEVKEFEDWIINCGNIPERLYDLHYQRYYKELEKEFFDKIRELKNDKLKRIK